MKNHLLIFRDHRGHELFFLRLRGTASEVQELIESQGTRLERDFEWASIKWEQY
jgi:hypothetical protein